MTRQTRKRAGLSLLEVLVALAIFMLSVVVVSQMVDSAARTGMKARNLTRAAILAEAKMEEIVAGAHPLQSTGLAPLESGEPGWQYAVTVEPESWSSAEVDGQTLAGLNTVHVTMVYTGAQGGDQVEYTLARMVLDPRLRVPQPTPQPTTTTSTSSGTSSQNSAGGGRP